MNLLEGVKTNNYQRRFMAAALESAIHQPGMPLFETRAPGFVSQNWLLKNS